jgi:glycerol-3-phosphate dehydrogenase (NAD(P)+)
VPAQASSEVLQAIPNEYLINKPVIMCAKGLEKNTLLRQSEILKNIAPNATPMVLSGPSFAKDVAKGLPTAITLAGIDENLTKNVAKAIAGASFRPYVRFDMIGVELAGSLKNVYALACGAVDGAELGLSARSALIARSYAEMERLVLKLGGKKETMSGLAGLGDLTLSCTSTQSRNYYFGQQLGIGWTVAEIKKSRVKLAEGVTSAPVAQTLAKSHNIETPLIDAVNDLLEGKIEIKQLVIDLMRRPLKEEGI